MLSLLLGVVRFVLAAMASLYGDTLLGSDLILLKDLSDLSAVDFR